MLMLPDIRVRQRDSLLEIARALTEELDQDALLKRILKISADILRGQAGLIALRAEEGGWMIAASHGIPDPLIEYLDPLLASIPDNDDPAKFELPKISQILQDIAKIGFFTGVGLPLIIRSRVLGVIFVFRDHHAVFSNNDHALLQSFADQAAIAVNNAQLYSQTRQEITRTDALLDSVADGILILSPNHTIEKVNPAFARIHGSEIETLMGKNYEEVIEWHKISHGTPLKEAELNGWPTSQQSTIYIEGDLLKPDKSTLPIGVTYAPLLSPSGSLLNIIASARDISHFRAAEELKSTFISVVSHELKTPVALIKGYVGTLRRKDAKWDAKIIEDSLEVIEDEADRLAEMIDNLLDASRMQAGGFELNAMDFSLPLLAERLSKRFQTQTNIHTIEIDFPPDFPIVVGDEDRIAQVMYNLVSNAIKYSPKGGLICISGEAKEDEIIVSVRDEGQGIAPADIPRIFDRFYRAETAQRKTKGAGLGLFLAQAVIEAHNGIIWVDSRYTNGARVCFSLPRPKDQIKRKK
jgi:PAS domain S-box-containing protein